MFARVTFGCFFLRLWFSGIFHSHCMNCDEQRKTRDGLCLLFEYAFHFMLNMFKLRILRLTQEFEHIAEMKKNATY